MIIPKLQSKLDYYIMRHTVVLIRGWKTWNEHTGPTPCNKNKYVGASQGLTWGRALQIGLSRSHKIRYFNRGSFRRCHGSKRHLTVIPSGRAFSTIQVLHSLALVGCDQSRTIAPASDPLKPLSVLRALLAFPSPRPLLRIASI